MGRNVVHFQKTEFMMVSKTSENRIL